LLRDVHHRTVQLDSGPPGSGSRSGPETHHVALFEQMTMRPFRPSR